jgi:hypothetical protein
MLSLNLTSELIWDSDSDKKRALIAVLKIRKVMMINMECHTFNQATQHPVVKHPVVLILPVHPMKRKLDKNFDRLENMKPIQNSKQDIFQILQPFQTCGCGQHNCFVQRKGHLQPYIPKKHIHLASKFTNFVAPLDTRMT